MTEIIDLDDSGLFVEPKRVKIRGEVYTLPGDVPATLYVHLLAVAQRGTEEIGDAKVMHDELLGMFQVHQPDMTSLPLGIKEMSAAIAVIYGGAKIERRPTRPAKKPATKRTPRSTSRTSSRPSRSRSST